MGRGSAPNVVTPGAGEDPSLGRSRMSHRVRHRWDVGWDVGGHAGRERFREYVAEGGMGQRGGYGTARGVWDSGCTVSTPHLCRAEDNGVHYLRISILLVLTVSSRPTLVTGSNVKKVLWL